MTWSIEFERSAAREFRKLAPEAQRRIRHYLTARVLAQEHPRNLGKPKEPLIEYPRARRRLCGRLRLGLGECGLVVPNKRAKTSWRPRKDPSRQGFAGKAASRAVRPSAVAMATVTRLAPHDLRLF